MLCCFVLSSQSFAISPYAFFCLHCCERSWKNCLEVAEQLYRSQILKDEVSLDRGLHEQLACCWTKPLVLSTLCKFSFSRTHLHGAHLAFLFPILTVDIPVVVSYQVYVCINRGKQLDPQVSTATVSASVSQT